MQDPRPYLVIAAALCCTNLTAQATSFFTSPKGYGNENAGSYSAHWGMVYWDGRTQMVERNVGSASVLNRLEYRSTSRRSYNLNTKVNLGRSYTNVTLIFAPAKATQVTTFASNYKSSGKTVYNASLKTPDLNRSWPEQKWGNVLSLSLKPYTHTGGDLLMDWFVAGGKLNNGYSSGRGRGRDYDALSNLRPSSASSVFLHPESPSGPGCRYVPERPAAGVKCTDTAHGTIPFGDATGFLSLSLSGDFASNRTLRGKLRVEESSCRYCATTASTNIAVLTVGGSEAGAALGAKCNKLHANMGAVLAMVAKKPGTVHSTDHLKRFATVTYQKAWAGSVLYWQCAFTDSKSNRFSLSKASRILLPAKPGTGPVVRAGSYVYRYKENGKYLPSNTNASYGIGPFTRNLPILVAAWNRK